MRDLFIQNIKLNKVRNLHNFAIPLDVAEKKHLIITGKNGSGKTTLLNELRQHLAQIPKFYPHYEAQLLHLAQQQDALANSMVEAQKNQHIIAIRQANEWLAKFANVDIKFSSSYNDIAEAFNEGNFIVAYFSAKRDATLKQPNGIIKFDFKNVYRVDENAAQEFIQYIVNLKADRSFARDENDTDAITKIDRWFDDFEKNLRRLFDSNIKQGVALKFDRKNYNFNIIENNKEPYNLNQLSDGFSAILNILTDLIMRMESHRTKNYDLQGVVLIDEIETHLHIDLQKKILPFLTSFFPKVQFIVTTHSPFVLNSVDDSTICDLEKRIVTTDLSGYSYDTLIESYFDSNKYSELLLEKINDYELLSKKVNKTAQDDEQLRDLHKYFDGIPKFISDELAVKIQQIKISQFKKRN